MTISLSNNQLKRFLGLLNDLRIDFHKKYLSEFEKGNIEGYEKALSSYSLLVYILLEIKSHENNN